MNKILFHIADKNQFNESKKEKSYIVESLHKEGFIHCSLHYQLEEVANFIFKGKADLVLLAIDTDKVKPEIKYEGPSWNTFPHIYGPLNLDAVVRVFDFNESTDGFKIPDGAYSLAVEELSKINNGPLYRDSRHYDSMNSVKGLDESFYTEEASKINGSTLELACGTGRLTIPIALKGLNITGLDLSDSMLTLARDKARKEKLNIDFELGDFRMFDLEKKFDYIFCGFNSVQHLHEEKELRSFFECVKNHLADGGYFAFDIFNPSVAMLNRKSSERYLVSKYNDPNGKGEISVWEKPNYDSQKQLSRFHFEYELNQQIILEEEFSLRNYFPLEMDIYLRNNGLDVIKKYGDFKRSPFESSSMKQIYICRSW